ncbi:hypothetical protein [Raineya orbicola]|uniref:DUF2231 domain-containing protein n=1 Tax=Raineya orbicola TaxID=2016530 RepID=A0A2N3IE38_9BACT|nr:hypothetical protein [Raineya orbicola]PKQ68624.1 hypothetical protein Rain11_1602 [Raineya orbicola]
MNQAHFHLIVNHLPIIAPVIGLLVLLGGLVIKSEIAKRTAFLIFIFGAICTLPAFLSGEGAEDVLEKMSDVSHQLIHEHEEKAEIFAWASYLLGILASISLWASWKQKAFAKLMSYAVLAFSFLVMFLASQAGTSGGEIRHPEIRKENSPLKKADNPKNTDDD